MTDFIAQRAEEAIARRVFPGCVIGIVRAGGERSVAALGRTVYEGGDEVTSDTVYDLASVTKAIPTASLALMLIEEGLIALTDRVIRFIPELHDDFGATIEDLMRYRVRGPRLSKIAAATPDEMLALVYERGFDGPPGASEYTNLPALLVGIALERATGETLERLARRHLFDPLRMDSTAFFPDAAQCAPTEIDARGEVRGVPHDESAYVFARAHRAAGHAGLFSTAGDLLNFLGALLHGDFGSVVRGAEAGLGWETSAAWMGRFASPSTFGKTGFTGTSIMSDRRRGLGLVILSNRTYPRRPADSEGISAFRRDIAEIVFV